MEQIFFSEPTTEGKYVVVRYNDKHEKLIPVKGEVFGSEEAARARAHQLNEEMEEEMLKEKGLGAKDSGDSPKQ